MAKKKIKWKKLSPLEGVRALASFGLTFGPIGNAGGSRGVFPIATTASRQLARAFADQLGRVGVSAAGAVGCLQRTNVTIYACSGVILKEIVDNEIDLQLGRHEYFATRIADEIRNELPNADNVTPACAERYLFSVRDDSSLLAMAVVWYGGQGGSTTPVRYAERTPDGTEMAPCHDCVSISPLMVNVARNQPTS